VFLLEGNKPWPIGGSFLLLLLLLDEGFGLSILSELLSAWMSSWIDDSSSKNSDSSILELGSGTMYLGLKWEFAST